MHLLSFVKQLQGKPLSFNNLNDLSAARLLAAELDRPGCVIVKHANPCGVGVAETIEEAYAKALAGDPLSAYGGVVVVNRTLTAALAEALGEQFVEVLFAPAYEQQALELLAQKPSLRVLEHTEQRAPGRGRARLPARARRPPRPGSGSTRSRGARAWRSCAARCLRSSGTTCCSPGAS